MSSSSSNGFWAFVSNNALATFLVLVYAMLANVLLNYSENTLQCLVVLLVLITGFHQAWVLYQRVKHDAQLNETLGYKLPAKLQLVAASAGVALGHVLLWAVVSNTAQKIMDEEPIWALLLWITFLGAVLAAFGCYALFLERLKIPKKPKRRRQRQAPPPSE